MRDSFETRPESQACHTLTDWERKSKRHRGDVAKKENVCSFFKKPSEGKKNFRKRIAAEEVENEGEDCKVANKKKTTYNKLTNVPIFEYKSSKEIQVQNDSRATATLETETDFSRDARAIRERVLKKSEEALKRKKKSEGDEKLYKGIHGYTDYKAGFRREHTVANEKVGGAHGPLRASAHIRVSARFDYQPDICKDYKETGYCGYGD